MTAKLVAFVAQHHRHLAKYVFCVVFRHPRLFPLGIYYQGNPLASTLNKQKAQETEGRQGFGTSADVARGARGAEFENGPQLNGDFAYIDNYSRKYVWKTLKKTSKFRYQLLLRVNKAVSNISQHICLSFIVAVGRHFG